MRLIRRSNIKIEKKHRVEFNELVTSRRSQRMRRFALTDIGGRERERERHLLPTSLLIAARDAIFFNR